MNMKNLKQPLFLTLVLLCWMSIQYNPITAQTIARLTKPIVHQQTVPSFSQTALQFQLKFLADTNIENHEIQYRIVGYTSDKEIITLEKGVLSYSRLLNTSIDPGIQLRSIGLRVSWEEERRFYLLEPQQRIEKTLNLGKSKKR